MQNGRLTRVQKTARPQNIWPELWEKCTESQKELLIKEFADKKEAEAQREPVVGSGSDDNIAQASSSGDDHAQQAVIEVSAGVAPRTVHPEHLKPAQQKTVGGRFHLIGTILRHMII